MLQPKRTKFNKQHKGRNRGFSKGARKISFGEIGIKAIERARLTARQIESARQVLARETKRVGKVHVRVFPDKPITQKPLEVRQGKGKGGVEYWVARVQPGRIIFELQSVPRDIAIRALKKASNKLPFRARIVFDKWFEERRAS